MRFLALPFVVEGEIGNQNKFSAQILNTEMKPPQPLISCSLPIKEEYDGACLQMRLSYSPAAHFFLFLVQWTDCNLAGALALLRILIYKVYVAGTTTMSAHERKASIRVFYVLRVVGRFNHQ